MTISDIHIRYEDTLSNSSQPFAIGITLNRFSFRTSDSQGNDIYVDRTSGFKTSENSLLHKSANLIKFGCYCR